MTLQEKEAIRTGLALAIRILESKTERSSTMELPNIGPMFDDITIADKIQDLPFSQEYVESVLAQVNEAIATHSRTALMVNNATDLLVLLRTIIPKLIAL